MAIIKNVLKHTLGDASNIKGYIPAADRLKIRSAKDGSINLKTTDKDFNLKKDSIRSDIADKKSTKGYGKIFVDGEETYGKFNTGKDKLKTLIAENNKSLSELNIATVPIPSVNHTPSIGSSIFPSNLSIAS